MSRAWRADPKSVDQNWNAYFQAFGDLAEAGDDIEAGPSWGVNKAGSLARLTRMRR